MGEKSLVDLAYDVVSENTKPVPFGDVWKEVIKRAGLEEATANNGIAEFYTGLTFDGRFVKKEGNCWDLKSRYTYKDYHIDTNAFYAQEEIKSEDDEDSEEDKEYNAVFETPKPVDETEGFGNEEETEDTPKADEEGNENA